MNTTFEKAYLIILLFFLVLWVPKSVHAYVSPGSITLVMQVVAGFMVGGLAIVVMYWGKIKTKLFRFKNKS